MSVRSPSLFPPHNTPQWSLRWCCRALLLVFMICAFWPTGVAQAATFVVSNTNDSGPGSLRQAILDANARSGGDTIIFSLGSSVRTIRLNSALPTITGVVEINALGGSNCATMPPQPKVLLDGSSAGNGASGFKIEADGASIIGFYITNFRADGITVNADGVVVSCNVIGLNSSGAAAGNINYGVKVTGNNNVIGQLSNLTGNVVSDNFFGIVVEGTFRGNVIRGNYVGTTIDGNGDRGNENAGVALAFGPTNTTVGGSSASERNVISGNDTEGVYLVGDGGNNQVSGNFIGLNAAGTSGIPNSQNGLFFEDSDNNTIGGTRNGEGNRIAFNREDGIAVDNASRNNRFLANEIFSNNQLGIDLGNDGVTANDNGDGDSGANDKQNKPILAGALIDNNRMETEAVLSSLGNTDFRIDFFASDSCDASGFGEGATFLGSGSMRTNSGGNGQLDITFPKVADGTQITAIATSNNGNGSTSEFSECVSVFTLSPPAAPQLTPDTATTDEDTAVTIDVLRNDFQGSGSALTIVAVGDPQSGTARIVDNKIVYTPNANFSGGDSFFYSAHNGNTANTRQTTVRVQVTEISDGPTDILLNTNSVVENSRANAVVGRFSAVDDSDGRFLIFSLVGSDNDNSAFSTFFGILRLQEVPDFETKSSYVIDVQVRNASTRQSFTKRFTINVTDANDAPTDIGLSNNRIDENQSAGVTVGTLSSQDVDAGDSHSYALVNGSGSDDNDLFRINGSTLQTNALLDFEEKPVYSIRVRSTDSGGATFEEILLVNVNNLPSPPDAIPNTLSSCSGDAITLIDRGSGGSRVLVRITDVAISNKTSNTCTVTGKLNITTNGSTVSNLNFSGEVNPRDQFRTSSIPDFTISIAGLPLAARDVEVAYNNERPHLHITRPGLQMPKEFGGLSAALSVPTLIDSGGLKIGSGTINLPTISTKSGFEMSLTGSLSPRGEGFQIDADGTLAIPNIGKKKKPGSSGRTCEISAGVTIFAGAQNQTVMVIAAGEMLTQQRMGPYLANASPNTIMDPDAFDEFRLDAIRASASCDPGLPIGNTGLFLTGLGGEITITPGEERLDVEVTIEAGKSVPGLGPIIAMDGSMGFQPRPLQLDLGGVLTMLSFEIASADATITTGSFRTAVRVQGFLYNASAEFAVFTRNGSTSFAGSGRVAVEIRKGAFVQAGECFLGIFICPPALPPFSLGELASVSAEVGEFTQRIFRQEFSAGFGFRGTVSTAFGSFGFFVDERGSLSFGDNSFLTLVTGPTVAAARAEWLDALNRGEIVGAASADGAYIFLQNVNGIEGNDGVVINAPLTKQAIDPGQVQASDVISQVNLIQHGDVIFNMVAEAPLAFTLITPDGKEVTPDNYEDSATLGYTINYIQTTAYEPASREALDQEQNSEGDAAPQLLFTPLDAAAGVNGVDLRIDGIDAYFNMNFPNSQQWLKPLPLAPGEHTVELVKDGTVVRSGTVNLPATGYASIINVGGAAPGFVTLTDDYSAPSTLGKAKIRFFNGSSTTVTLFVNGSPVIYDTGYKGVSSYIEVNAGTQTVQLRNSGDNTVVAELTGAELADGGVYTFLSTDASDGGFDITLVQRTDALYKPGYQTYYSVDQAQMNETWQMKVVGDTDNTFYQLSVIAPDSPPILGSVAVDASNLAATQVSFQLTSDNRPTRLSIYANPGTISASIPLTVNGTVDTEQVPIFEGSLVAEYEIVDIAELGGALVTKVIDLSVLPSGTYHLWVRADDGVNQPVSTYAEIPSVTAAGVQSVYGTNPIWLAKDDFNPMATVGGANTIVIDHSDDFPTTWTATISNTFDSETRSLYIEWKAHSHPDTDLYRLLFGNSSMNPTQVITVGNSIQEIGANGLATDVEVGFVTLRDIQPGVTYFLMVEGVDTDTGNTVRSQEFTFSVEPGTFSLSSAQATVNVAAGGSATVPVTLNADEALFFPNVWLSSDLGEAAAGITARFADDVDGLVGINPGSNTRQFEINVDASVPQGTYPITITGYAGEAKETLTIQVVVGEVGEMTERIYLPVVLR